ncbi:MAG: oligosaccharide flippase family protein [Planctomycetales bacterium]|nr:oligosaccharide flippase family protein [Planctomycetales bacterium]NIM08400.1 oligosaccharide flippase family protein [Planctomycetales bacterium]NIN07875.1 oligosaccharide flippase family protein [Planctomycetales bacterium]NIN77005.1 oligosaccharide flippase family protein [Planctomycetales bacterium]NIO34188.1 oligosaccharide flippase family protein [Planctomycetales bacterium]
MTSAAHPLPSVEDTRLAVRRDTLAASVMFLMALSCVQPLISFGRGLLFCRWLDPEQLGCWDMALSFLTLIAPVVVLGIPGSFGRYVEHFAQRGQLATFLRRTGLACLVLGTAAVALVAWQAGFFAGLIFGRQDLVSLVHLVAVCLASMVAFGFVIELLTALRMFRVVSLLHFVKGVMFALSGAGLLLVWTSAASILVSYTLACLLASALSLWWLLPTWKSLPAADSLAADSLAGSAALSRRGLWAKLMPFAAWVWLTNLTANLFEITDRYMIVHFSGMPNAEALLQVGYYHSSRLVPLLLISFAGMLASLILPHLARDWEAGRRQVVSSQVILGLKLCSLFMAATATAVMLAGPWLFEVVLEGKYASGLAVMPWTLAYCVWFGLVSVAEMYLWCAERVRLGTAALAVGVVVNVVLNLLLLPSLGLLGAVLATAASKLFVLTLIYTLSHLLGLPFDWRLWALAFLPLLICLGPAFAAAALAVLGLAVIATPLVLTAAEKDLLATALTRCWKGG